MGRPTLVFGAYSAVLGLVGLDVIRALIGLARDNPTVSHVVAVPVAVLGLLYLDRARILGRARPALRGGAAVAAVGLVLFAAGGGMVRLSTTGLVVAWIGGFIGAYGWLAARAAMFPLGFLFLVVPLPDAVVDGVTAFLKAGSAEAVGGLFALTGTPFHREGFVFSLPGAAIEIADECSGIRSSISLVLTGLLAGHTFLRRPWTRGLLVLAILPIAVLKNAIRIAALSLLAIYVDPGFLVGQLHHEGGFVFFLLALAMMAPLLPILRRAESPARIGSAA